MNRFRALTDLGIALTLALTGALLWGPADSADAAIAAAACCNPGVFTGTDTAGNFENAIANAVASAMTCAGCCDRQVSYRVTQITGVVGGITARNDITVEIIASW